MKQYNPFSPLLDDDSPLNDAAREVVFQLNQRRPGADTWFTKVRADRRKRVEVVTWDEMQGQPGAIQGTMDQERKKIEEIAAFLAKKPLERVYIFGCGDSWYSALGVRMLFETVLGIPCEPMQALDFGYYYYTMANEKTLTIALSSSGGTARTTEAMFMAQAQGAQSIAITNSAGSAMDKGGDHTLLVHAVRQGWPTQASTAAVALMDLLAIEIARKKGGSSAELDKLEKALYQTPEMVGKILKSENDKAIQIAEKETNRHIYLFAGGGPAYSCAMFGAAKIKEMTPADHAYALPQEEYHHFDSGKEGDPVFIIAPEGRSVPRATNTAERTRIQNAQAYGVVTKGGSPLLPFLDAAFELPAMDERLVPIVYTVPLQMFAYHVGMTKFRREGY